MALSTGSLVGGITPLPRACQHSQGREKQDLSQCPQHSGHWLGTGRGTCWDSGLNQSQPQAPHMPEQGQPGEELLRSCRAARSVL